MNANPNPYEGVRRNNETVVFYHVLLIGWMILLAIGSSHDISNYEWPYDELDFTHSGAVRMLCYSSASFFALVVSLALGLGWTIPLTVIGMWLGRVLTPWSQDGDYDVNYMDQQVYSRWGIVFGALMGFLFEVRRRRKLRNQIDEITNG